MPQFKLNELTDTLLKKEFDQCRKDRKPHRKFIEKGLDHIVPAAPKYSFISYAS